jgi:DNA-binding transcriptional MerR regulator
MNHNADISIKDIKELLKQRQKQIKGMEVMTKSTREKLKKINKILDERTEELLKINYMILADEMKLSDIDSIQTPNIDTVYSKLEEIQQSLRKTRNYLADLINNKR